MMHILLVSKSSRQLIMARKRRRRHTRTGPRVVSLSQLPSSLSGGGPPSSSSSSSSSSPPQADASHLPGAGRMGALTKRRKGICPLRNLGKKSESSTSSSERHVHMATQSQNFAAYGTMVIVRKSQRPDDRPRFAVQRPAVRLRPLSEVHGPWQFDVYRYPGLWRGGWAVPPHRQHRPKQSNLLLHE